MKILNPVLSLFFNIIEFFDRLFRSTPKPSVPSAEAPTEIFENDAQETAREIEERKSAPEPPRNESEIVAPKGICLRKSVLFRTRHGPFLSAKVVGYSWEDSNILFLSRNGGPLFKRRFC